MTTWRVSSYSGSQGECVEVGKGVDGGLVQGRDQRGGGAEVSLGVRLSGVGHRVLVGGLG